MWIAIALILLFLAFDVIMYNRMIRARNMVREAWSGIDVQLKRRHDLVPNLVETVEGYTSHERTLFDGIARTRAETMSATTPGEKAPAENSLSQQLKSLFAIAEAYPDLKANQNFLALQEELASTENKISFARQFYNDAVMLFNTKIQSVPTNIIAGMFGFKEEKSFELDSPAEKEVPKVSFS